MAKKTVKEWATPLLSDLDSMIDRAVGSMDRKKLDKLEIKRKAIMGSLKQSTHCCPGKNERSYRKALTT